MKTILFSGFKGGTGKTYLATTFSRFLLDDGHSVALMGFDSYKELSFLRTRKKVDHLPLLEPKAHQFALAYDSIKNYDYLIIDGSFLPIADLKNIVQYTTSIIIPFQIDDLNAIKLFGFRKFLDELHVHSDCLFAVPNNNTLRHFRSEVYQRIQTSAKSMNINILPPIAHLNLPSFFDYTTKQLYELRPFFLPFVNK